MNKKRLIVITVILILISGIFGIGFLKYKLTRAINLAAIEELFEKQKYDEIIGILNEEKNGLKSNEIEIFRKLTFRGRTLALYADGANLLAKEQWSEAEDILTKLNNYIFENYRMLGLEEKTFKTFVLEIYKELGSISKEQIRMEELNKLREKWLVRAKELSGDKSEPLEILVNSIVGMALCDSYRNDK